MFPGRSSRADARNLASPEHSGAFLVDAQIFDEPLLPHAADEGNAEKLWELSEKLVGEKFVY